MTYRQARADYRHHLGSCSRLLFRGYLPPGTDIEIRCPKCGRMHVIHVAPAPHINGTSILNGDYHIDECQSTVLE